MNRLSLLPSAVLIIPVNAFAHTRHIEWGQFAAGDHFEWAEASFVITALIIFLFSNHFNSLRRMTSRSKKQQKNNK